MEVVLRQLLLLTSNYFRLRQDQAQMTKTIFQDIQDYFLNYRSSGSCFLKQLFLTFVYLG